MAARRRARPILTLALVGAALALELLPAAAERLRFERAALGQGELWRFLTGHLVHGARGLAALDLLVLGALGAWWELRSRAVLAEVLLVSATLSSATLLLWTSFESYVGSSALSSGLFAAAALALALEGRGPERGVGAVALGLFGLKLALELLGFHPGGFVALPPSTTVAGSAHLSGGLGGALVVVGRRLVGSAGGAPPTRSSA